MAGLSPFTVMTNIFVIEFAELIENIKGKLICAQFHSTLFMPLHFNKRLYRLNLPDYKLIDYTADYSRAVLSTEIYCKGEARTVRNEPLKFSVLVIGKIMSSLPFTQLSEEHAAECHNILLLGYMPVICTFTLSRFIPCKYIKLY